MLGALLRTRNEQAAIHELLGYHSEALILIGGDADTRQLATVISRVPIVEIGRKVNDPAIDVVRTDGAQGVKDAVNHLVSLGHRDIVHVDGQALPAAAERRHGYQAAMRRHELHDNIRVIHGDYTEESGVRAARMLLAEGSLPTAVVAGNDECALGLIESFIREGVDVPGDISVVGFDDSRLARLSFLNLTTVRQDSVQMAEAAVHAATRRLEDETAAARHIVLPPTLIIRQTTGPVRRQDVLTA